MVFVFVLEDFLFGVCFHLLLLEKLVFDWT